MRLAARPVLARIAVIDSAIRSGSHPNAVKLAQQLEVNHRTIQRDLDFLKSRLGAPLRFDAAHNGFYYTEPNYNLPLTRLTHGEIVAVCLAAQVLEQYRGTPFAGELNQILARLQELLPDEIELHPADLAAINIVPMTVPDQDPKVFRTIAAAAVGGDRLELDYFSASRNARSTRRVDPYRLALIHGEWYLIAHCQRRNAVLMFATHRIHSAQLVGEQFARPADFSIREYLGSSFRAMRGRGKHRVELWFAPPAAARAAERQWHESQTTKRHSDGSVRLRFVVSDLSEIKRWVLSWGSACVVKGPKGLVLAMRAEVAAIEQHYRGNAWPRTMVDDHALPLADQSVDRSAIIGSGPNIRPRSWHFSWQPGLGTKGSFQRCALTD